MSLCRHCGVEVDNDVTRCPLCRRPLRGEGDQVATPPPQPVAAPPAASRLLRRWLLEIFTVLAVCGAIVVSAADLAYGMSFTWSRYVLVSIGFLWLSGVLLIVCLRWWLLYVVAETAAVGLFLWLLDGLTPGASWFPSLAFPITLLAGTLLVLTLSARRLLGNSLLAILSIATLAPGLFVLGLELILNDFLLDRLFVSWSAVAFACALPFVLILLILRRWFRKKESEFRRVFHL